MSRLVLACAIWICSPNARAAQFYFPQRRLGIHGVGWVDEHDYTRSRRHQLTQKFQRLSGQLKI